MSRFLEISILVVYAMIIISQVIGLFKAVRWGRKNDYCFRLLPNWKDVLVILAMAIGAWIGIKIYHYWGWTLLESLVYYGFIPLMLYSLVMWMNRGLVGAHRLSMFMRDEYTLFIRLMLWSIRVWNTHRQSAK